MPLTRALFDEGRLDEMKEELGEGPVLAVLGKLSGHVAESAQRIAELYRSGDLSAMRREAHSLKGAAAMAAAPRLEAVALNIEQGDTDTADAIALLNSCAEDMASYIHDRFG